MGGTFPARKVPPQALPIRCDRSDKLSPLPSPTWRGATVTLYTTRLDLPNTGIESSFFHSMRSLAMPAPTSTSGPHDVRLHRIDPVGPTAWKHIEICSMHHYLLYRFFNEESLLLYLGITWSPRERWARHRRSKSWWPQVRTASTECYPAQWIARRAELEAIRIEHPVHNIIGVIHRGN